MYVACALHLGKQLAGLMCACLRSVLFCMNSDQVLNNNQGTVNDNYS